MEGKEINTLKILCERFVADPFDLEINRLALIDGYSHRIRALENALKLRLMKEAADKNEYCIKDDSCNIKY